MSRSAAFQHDARDKCMHEANRNHKGDETRRMKDAENPGVHTILYVYVYTKTRVGRGTFGGGGGGGAKTCVVREDLPPSCKAQPAADPPSHCRRGGFVPAASPCQAALAPSPGGQYTSPRGAASSPPGAACLPSGGGFLPPGGNSFGERGGSPRGYAKGLLWRWGEASSS